LFDGVVETIMLVCRFSMFNYTYIEIGEVESCSCLFAGGTHW